MKDLKGLIGSFLLGISFYHASTQDIRITGRLVEDATSTEIPFAHVYVRGTTLGTLTNIEGSYSLNLSSSYKQDSIVFSCVGFQSRIIPLQQLVDSFQVIRLKEAEVVLEEVVVSNLSARSIWNNAVKKKSENFSTGHFRLTGFYRTAFQEDGQFTKLLEAAVYIHGDRFIKKKAAIEYLQIRKTKDLRAHKWKVNDGYLEHLVNSHPLRWIPDFLHPIGKNKYQFEIADILFRDNERYYEINAKGPSKSLHDAQMLIKADNFEIYRITIFWKPENAGNFSWAWEKKDDAKFFCDEQTSVYEYVAYQGKMVPKRSSWHRKGRVIKTKTGETLFRTESIDELLITNIDSKQYSFENKTPVEVQNIYEMAEYFPYDVSFWKTFNRPVDSKLFTRAKQKLKVYQPLESQFREYSGLKAE